MYEHHCGTVGRVDSEHGYLAGAAVAYLYVEVAHVRLPGHIVVGPNQIEGLPAIDVGQRESRWIAPIEWDYRQPPRSTLSSVTIRIRAYHQRLSVLAEVHDDGIQSSQAAAEFPRPPRPLGFAIQHPRPPK